MNIRRCLDERLSAAMSSACGSDFPAIVVPSSRPQFGDYQANGVMPAAKAGGAKPRELAEKVVAAAEPDELLAGMIESLEVAGPGFLNIRLRGSFLANQLDEARADKQRLGIAGPRPQTVVVDYSAPNLAKEMHVGHLRSTIIGDALVRTLEFLGHKVFRQNHVGDWGTQFGMLVANMPKFADLLDLGLPDLEAYYVEAKRRFDTEPGFADKARAIVSEMHSMGPGAWKESDAILRWRNLRRATLQHCYELYGRLGIWFTPSEFRAKWQPHGPGQVVSELAPPEETGIVGESFYNDDLRGVVGDLAKAGLLTESEGAKCVFLDEFKGRDGDVLPVIVQKSDGGYLYATTDLAAVRYRVDKLKADRVLYVIDSRQSLHLRQVFAVARAAGFAPAGVSLEHVPFGMMMGPDGRPFKTREGGTVKLMSLLDEAEAKALELVNEKNPALDEQEKRTIAHIVGIGAVKYADLSQNRTSDYVFSFAKMLSLEGNTAPYMQYAYARIRSIFRKGGVDPADLPASPIAVAAPAERALALKLVQLGETLQAVADECLPNLLCNHLYDLAVAFTSFYESCPVLKSDEPLRSSRLALCDLTAKTIHTGLGLLGIETVEQM